jgi:septal ring factor EnvC (AmiA/AmiB activator)
MPFLVLTSDDWYGLKRSIDTLASQGAKIMVDLASITTQITALTNAVAAEKTVEDSAVTLIQGMAASLKTLQDQLASFQAGTVTQAQIDDLATQVGAQVDALHTASGPLSDAIASSPPGPAPV